MYNGLQGHPSSLILAPIESAYMRLPFLLVLSYPVSEILQVFCKCFLRRATPFLFYPNYGDVPLELDWTADVVAPRSEDSKLIIRVVSFEVTQQMRPRYVNVTDRETDKRTNRQADGRTTYDSNTALCAPCIGRLETGY